MAPRPWSHAIPMATTFTAPAGVAGNWDAHVFNLPMASSTGSFSVDGIADWIRYQDSAVSVAGTVGPVNIYSGATGTNLLPITGAPATNAYATVPAALNTDISGGISRVLGMGFEVTNTTAEINKQGSVTCYRMPQNTATGQIIVANFNNSNQGTVVMRRMRTPPSTVAQANLLKGTRTWDAASGVYAVPVQNSMANPLQLMNTELGLIQAEATPGLASTAIRTPYGITGAGTAVPAMSAYVPNAQQFTPFDTTGAYFTGLSNATILTIKVKIYVERAPTFSEANLAVLASPSAGYDVNALTLYARCVSELPVAVKVGDNASGDWWRSALSVLSKVAGPVGMALNTIMPGAGGIGLAIQAASAVANAAAAQKKKLKAVTKSNPKLLPAPQHPARTIVQEAGSRSAKGKKK